MKRKVTIELESWPCIIPFRISSGVSEDFPAVVCKLSEDGITGRGEALGVYNRGETRETMAAEIEAVADVLASGIDRHELQDLMPPGGARFAVDSALWDLDAQRTGVSAWETAGVRPDPVETVFTIGLEDTPQEMATKAIHAGDLTLFKVKLGGDRPVERIEAIRKARPDARLVIDANQAWTIDELKEYAPALHALDVLMIEQPLPRGKDEELEGFVCDAPLCADESCEHLGELEDAARRYQMINIKLDKSGGLTHGLELAAAAKNKGMRLMVGCMGGTSLSMAPSHVIAQLCEFVDIDGPLLIKKDREGGLIYEGGMVSLPEKHFWG